MWQRWDFIGTGDIEISLRDTLDKTEEQLIIDQSTPSGILTEGHITCMIVSTKAKKPTLSTNIKEQDRKFAFKQTNLTIRRTICQETICFIEPMYTNLPLDLMSTGHNQMIILVKNR